MIKGIIARVVEREKRASTFSPRDAISVTIKLVPTALQPSLVIFKSAAFALMIRNRDTQYCEQFLVH